ncbi:hypothetical protein OH799_29535 [Nocardia sp. NBC_00881]|uniref:hypothetical protein n=1 Tax=Nocardia sp. NBC_00881 TaxID=2975995 RepID=UPI00386497A5|nr:hypothetical protein OH799_29535 [Nocardia sp. NBC_00881]
MKSGSTIELWADAYREESDHYVFSAFVHASLDEQRHVEVESRGAGKGENVVIVMARVPTVEVESINGGPVGFDFEAD